MTIELSAECSISVFGTLRRHHWISPRPDDLDAYGLFEAYSDLVGFRLEQSNPTSAGLRGGNNHANGLWATVDAGGDWSDEIAASPGHILWVEVGLCESPRASDVPISALTFLIEKCVNRIGQIEIDACQTLIPLNYAAIKQPSGHMLFATADPQRNVILEIEIAAPADGSLDSRAQSLFEEANARLEYDGIEFTQPTIGASGPNLFREPSQIDRRFLAGSHSARVRSRISVPELSFDFVSYLTSHIALASQLTGVSGSELVSIRRSSSVHRERSD